MSYDHWKTTEPEPPFEQVQCPYCDGWVAEVLGCPDCDWRPVDEDGPPDGDAWSGGFAENH